VAVEVVPRWREVVSSGDRPLSHVPTRSGDRVHAVTRLWLADAWARPTLNFSPIFKHLEILKFKMKAFSLSKIYQTLHGDNLKHEEKRSFLP
jgi:hypothetical protein